MKHDRSKYYPYILTLIAVITVVLFSHGEFVFTNVNRDIGRSMPNSSSVEVVQFAAATGLARGSGSGLEGDMAQFPETVGGKQNVVPACSPAYLALLSIPAKLADSLTPQPANLNVSSQLDPEKTQWEKNYLNYSQRYKLTVIFLQGPFLVLLLLYFYFASARFLPAPPARLWLTIGLCFGTLVYPFALTINPLLPCAALILCGLHHGLKYSERSDIVDGVAAGLYLGAALFIDHMAYIPAVVLMIAIALKAREPERLLPVIGGMIPGIAIFIYSHYSIFGDPLPAIFHRSGGQAGIMVIWRQLVWSILGYNGAAWMAPAITLALVYTFSSGKNGERTGALYSRAIGIAAALLLIVSALESVYTFTPLTDPDTKTTYQDVYSAGRAPSPQLQVDVAGFPMLVAFHSKLFGGEAFAIIGPSLLLMSAGIFGREWAWKAVGGAMLRLGVFIGVFAAVNPLGARIFPLVENLHRLGYELSLRFPREAIF